MSDEIEVGSVLAGQAEGIPAYPDDEIGLVGTLLAEAVQARGTGKVTVADAYFGPDGCAALHGLGPVVVGQLEMREAANWPSCCQARKSNCRRKHASCVRSNAQPHPEPGPPVGKPSRRPGTRPPCRADTSPLDRSSRPSRASSPRRRSRSATRHQGRGPTPSAAGQRHCRAHACARSPWFVGRGCQDRERREVAAATLQIDPSGEMLCFASAQDRTNPRRIKDYFNANGVAPPVASTPAETYAWARADGQRMAANPELTAQAQADIAECQAETPPRAAWGVPGQPCMRERRERGYYLRQVE